MYQQHRHWTSDDFRLICTQDFSEKDHDRTTAVAKAFGVLDQMTEFKATVEDLIRRTFGSRPLNKLFCETSNIFA